MQKSELESFVQVLENAGVGTFSIRYEDASRVSVNDSETSLVRFLEDGAIVLEREDNYMANGPFAIRKVCYDDIASIQTRGLTVSETLKIMEGLGLNDDKVKELVAKAGGRIKNIPGRSGYGDVKDDNGNPVLMPGSVGMVTTGLSK